MAEHSKRVQYYLIMCRFKIGALVTAVVCVQTVSVFGFQVCSTVGYMFNKLSQETDRIAVVRRDPVLGAADGVINRSGANVAQVVGMSTAQSHLNIVRRNAFAPDLLGATTGKNNQLKPGVLLDRRDPLLGTADGAVKGVGTVGAAAQAAVSVLRRDPLSTDGLPGGNKMKQEIATLGRRATLYSSFKALKVRDISGEAQASITSTGLADKAKKVFDRATSSGPQLRKRIDDGFKLGRRDINGDNIKLGVKVDRRYVTKDIPGESVILGNVNKNILLG
uniref:Uncharacterized protein n=2 Tax=Cacopsylla melanoneura TaxID=428564 RepID=A0A8D9F3D6_9HEMI